MSIPNKPVPASSVARAAVRDIKTLAGMCRGLIALADELGSAEDLQSFQKQEEQRLSELKAESVQLSQQVSDSKSELAAQIAAGQQTIRRLSDESEGMQATLRVRREEAAQIIESAKREAASIVAAAQDQARLAVAAEVEKIKARL